jgi:hypothetical protein
VPTSVAALVAGSCRSEPLSGAARVASAAGEPRLVVEVGFWLDGTGRVERARYRATTCAALIAYAEAGCAIAEAEGAAAVSPARLRDAVSGVHPVHHDRAELVALAFARASGASPQEKEPA